MHVGFIGLGDMGGAIAKRIIDAGFTTTLWARRQASLDAYRDNSARFAETLHELGSSCNFVGVCVFNDEDVIQVVDGDGSGFLHTMSPGGVIAIHSTVTPKTCQRLAEVAEKRGVDLIDAPVSGARVAAETGTLCIMVGGTPAAFEKARPVFASYGKVIELLGQLGSGQCAKVINNVLTFVNVTTAYHALEVGGKLGIDVEKLKLVLSSGGGNSFGLYALTQLLMPDPAYSAHAMTMVKKDTSIFQQLCRDHGVARTHLDTLAEENYRILERFTKQ